MIHKIRGECGHQYTSKLEGMSGALRILRPVFASFRDLLGPKKMTNGYTSVETLVKSRLFGLRVIQQERFVYHIKKIC